MTYGDRDGARIVRRLSVNATTHAVLRAMLGAVPCPCGREARRLIVECDPPVRPVYGTPAYRAVQRRKGPDPLRVRAWCGDADSHPFDGTEDTDPEDVALCECDL